MAAPHAHNDIEINYCSGPLVYLSGGQESRLPPATPCAFWGATPHQLVQIERGRQLSFVTIPLATFMSWSIPDATKQGLLQGAVLLGQIDSVVEFIEPAISRWAADLAADDAVLRRVSLLEVEALLWRMSRGSWAKSTPRHDSSSRDLTRAAGMATFIADRFKLDIHLRDVSSSVYLHPNRAASVFLSVFAVSVKEYLNQHRVAEAQRLLITTDLSSSSIAKLAGFQSLSAYHDNFIKVCRATPLQWRSAHLG